MLDATLKPRNQSYLKSIEMKNNLKILIVSIMYLITLISCEKNDDLNTSFDDVKIKQIIIEETNYTDTISFEYNENDLLIKGVHCGGMYFTNEYDSLNRLIRTNRFNSTGLYHYFTFQYDSNTITRIRYQYYPYTDSWGGDNEKSVYCYNSQNQCERIDYYNKDDNENWIKSDYYTLCNWSSGNLIELKNFNGNNIDHTEKYQYDNKLNPEKLLDYIISPWTKSKNNPISILTAYSDGRETSTTFNYTYNEFGYPIKKDRIDDVGTHTEKYEYEFQ